MGIKKLKSIPQKIYSYILRLNHEYIIVGYEEKTEIVSLQCSITKSTITRNIIDVIFNEDILSQMLPEQACYLGIISASILSKSEIKKNKTFEVNAKGLAYIIDRHGNIVFINPETKNRCSYRPEYIASNQQLINLFHPAVACSIGVGIGFSKKIEPIRIKKQPPKLHMIINN